MALRIFGTPSYRVEPLGRPVRVMLITPPYHSGVVESAGVWMPVAFVYIAGTVREHGHTVKIYDAMSYYHDYDRIEQEIREFAPDVIGLTAITASSLACLRVCAIAKQVNPQILTIMGNAHSTFLWREILTEHPECDIVVRGEGEFTVAELADTLRDGGDLATILGVALRIDGQPWAANKRALNADLDSLPMAWDLIDWPIYTYRPRPGSRLAVVSSSRGCEEACSFCSQQLYWGRSWRGHSPKHFVDELQMLKERFGVSIVMLADETPTMDPDRWHALIEELIARDLDMELLMETRVDHILRDEDYLHRYKEAGISHIYVGVEATDQTTLDVFTKNIGVEQSRKAIAAINRHGMVSETSFVLGMPDETPEHMAATVELAKHYAPDLAFFLAITPWPYAQLYPKLKDHLVGLDFSHYNLVEPVIKPDNMTLEEVQKGLNQAAHHFYADKLRHLHELPVEKRSFLVKVMKILSNHSYLADHMQGIHAEMPAHVQQAMAVIEADIEAERVASHK